MSFLLLGVLNSCKKFVSIKPAPNLIQTNDLFSNDKTALSTVAGVYIQMRLTTTNLTDAGMSIFGGLSADEIYNTTSNSTWDPFTQNALLPNNTSILGNFWTPCYKNIYTCNAILEGLTKSILIADSLKKQLIGEIKFVRAWYYFYLVNLFGDVPLITTTDYQENSITPRTAVSEVYEQIISDLIEAQSSLKENYYSSGKIRPNKWAAAALLSRVYLYQKDWKNAETEASAIINSHFYSLLPSSSIQNTFLINSPETIWEIAPPNESSNTAIASRFVTSSLTSRPTFAITDTLFNTFELGDLRKSNWLRKNPTAGPPPKDYYIPYKYKERTSTTPLKEYNVVFRLAEQYLILAEAKAHLNDISGAQDNLNYIRNRAGLSNTIASDQVSLLSAIEHEREVELFCEWGNRWFDLKRTQRIDEVLGSIKGSNWQPTDALYPIPNQELLYNVFLTQNPGY